jgi:hypothetical protein
VTRHVLAVALVALVATGFASCGSGAAASGDTPGGWTAANSVTADAFARELASATGANTPVVGFVGPTFIYRTGHIPGAVLLGPASSPEGFAALKAWAQTLPKNANVVVYCGCCPLEVCPNLKPAYAALTGLGLTRVRVLLLPTSFGADWASKGLPLAR